MIPQWLVDYWQGWWAWQQWRWDHLWISLGVVLIAVPVLWLIGQGIALWQRWRTKP